MRCVVTASFWLASKQSGCKRKTRLNILKTRSKTCGTLYVFSPRLLWSAPDAEPQNLSEIRDSCRLTHVTHPWRSKRSMTFHYRALFTRQPKRGSFKRKYKLVYKFYDLGTADNWYNDFGGLLSSIVWRETIAPNLFEISQDYLGGKNEPVFLKTSQCQHVAPNDELYKTKNVRCQHRFWSAQSIREGRRPRQRLADSEPMTQARHGFLES